MRQKEASSLVQFEYKGDPLGTNGRNGLKWLFRLYTVNWNRQLKCVVYNCSLRHYDTCLNLRRDLRLFVKNLRGRANLKAFP